MKGRTVCSLLFHTSQCVKLLIFSMPHNSSEFFLHYCIPKENQAERYIPSYYKNSFELIGHLFGQSVFLFDTSRNV